MSKCWCRFGLAALVILFAWLPYPWTRIVVTVLAALLAGSALVGTCCCAAMAEAKGKAAETASEPAKE